jgi:hypothetical protein
MTVKNILQSELGSHFTISTEVFTLVAKLEIELEGGAKRNWLVADEDLLLAVNPEAEEMKLFSIIETPIEKDDDIVIEQGKEYELGYEDRGTVVYSDGEGFYDEGDELELAEYEADDGDTIKLITNTFNGEEKVMLGKTVTEEDVLMN